MVLKAVGVCLLIILTIPLIIALPPLAIVPLGAVLIAAGSRRRPARTSARRRGARRGGGRKARRSAPTALHRGVRRGLGWIAAAIVALAVGRLLLQEAPAALVVIGLAAGVLVLARRRGHRRRRRGAGIRQAPLRRQPAQGLAGDRVGTGTEFEWYVADLLASLDYRRVHHVGGAGDQGIDIIAEDKRGRTFLVQCKRFSTGAKVGSADVQKLIGAVVHHGADGGIIVTTSTYTPAAVKLVHAGRVPIALYDGNDVARLARLAS